MRVLLWCLLFLGAMSLDAGCGHRAEMQKKHQQDQAAADRKIPVVERPVLHEIDTELARTMRVGIWSSFLSIAVLVFMLFEGAKFIRLCLGISAACIASTMLMIWFRLAAPVVAMLVPWMLGIGMLALGIGILYWFKFGGVRLRLLNLLPKAKV